MKLNIQTKPIAVAAALSITLAACGGNDSEGSVDGATGAPGDTASEGSVLTLAENGPDLCFKAAAEKLGSDAKIATLSSNFGVGENLEKYAVVSTPAGNLKGCSLDYQDPEDPRKLLSIAMDVATGEFGEPSPVEISVMGNAADFNLDDYVVPLSQIKTAGVAATIEEQKAALDDTFSSHALSMVRLMQPGLGRDEHKISVDFAGRLKSNDVIDTGSLGINIDGSLDYNNIGK